MRKHGENGRPFLPAASVMLRRMALLCKRRPSSASFLNGAYHERYNCAGRAEAPTDWNLSVCYVLYGSSRGPPPRLAQGLMYLQANPRFLEHPDLLL